ncbi:MAG TPA: squalene synthase HpnC [Streptosporangiaceae bacterium]|nr:squalene synthase HpnC [Streptosporangiaceae bacterium]
MTRDRAGASACLAAAGQAPPRKLVAEQALEPEVAVQVPPPEAARQALPEAAPPRGAREAAASRGVRQVAETGIRRESVVPDVGREPGAATIKADATDTGALHAIYAGAPDKAGQENFPVALRLLPRRYREYLLAVYGYARVVDDAGDLAPSGQRGELLAGLAADVRRLYGTAAGGDGRPPVLPPVRDLAGVVRDCQLPIDPLLDLIRANEQDQVVTRYETFEELLGYCRLSANPVGRIVLHVFGAYSPQRAELSDAICTGLQLAEHWQDVAEDLRAGRVYLPAEDMRRYGCTEDDLRSPRAPDRVRQLMAFQVRRAGDLISAGAPLIGTLHGAPRAAVAGYVAGGRAALAAIAAAGYDVLASTPRPGKGRTAAEMIAAFARAR